MSNLDAIDRSASIFCLGLVALLMIVAPLFGVGEDRFHVTLNARTTQATIHRYSVLCRGWRSINKQWLRGGKRCSAHTSTFNWTGSIH